MSIEQNAHQRLAVYYSHSHGKLQQSLADTTDSPEHDELLAGTSSPGQRYITHITICQPPPFPGERYIIIICGRPPTATRSLLLFPVETGEEREGMGGRDRVGVIYLLIPNSLSFGSSPTSILSTFFYFILTSPPP